MKAPKKLNDLYLDLRDKRLLPVVVLLLVVLVAIPFLLGGESEPAIPPSDTVLGSAAANDADSAAELTPFVTADVPGIREFDQRLDDFKRRNPFKQQLTSAPKSAQKALDQLEDAVGKAGDAAAKAAGGDTSTSTSGSPSSTSPSSSSSTSSSSSGSGSTTEPAQVILFSWEIDVKVGPVGDAKKEKGVKPREFLPGNKRPVVQFVQGDFDATEAVFAVSRRVESTEGDGKCRPNRRECEFLLLKTGEEHRFFYGPERRDYRLKLLDVRLTKERVDPDKLSAKRAERSSGYERLADSIRE